MGETESAAPKICPLLTGLQERPPTTRQVATRQEPRKFLDNVYLHEVYCRKNSCEFWSEKEKVCSFVRKVEYETLLEKIIQSKK